MTFKGKARGRIIELEMELPFPEGEAVEVTVTAQSPTLRRGSPKLILAVMQSLPRVDRETVDEFERAIEEGSLPAADDSPFE